MCELKIGHHVDGPNFLLNDSNKACQGAHVPMVVEIQSQKKNVGSTKNDNHEFHINPLENDH